MKTYPKIETLFNRGEDFSVTDDLRREEYDLISEWVLTEKVDGTNIRLHWERGPGLTIGGKTDRADVPKPLLAVLQGEADRMHREVQAILDEFSIDSVTLFGEGYGPKIQNGGRYRPEPGFILFDVLVNDTAWLDEGQVTDTANRLGIERVPTVGVGSLADAVSLVRPGFASDVALVFDAGFHAEGVVAKTAVPLYDRRGDRLMWKLKARDYRAGKR